MAPGSYVTVPDALTAPLPPAPFPLPDKVNPCAPYKYMVAPELILTLPAPIKSLVPCPDINIPFMVAVTPVLRLIWVVPENPANNTAPLFTVNAVATVVVVVPLPAI